MPNLAMTLSFLALLFYLQEVVSDKPDVFSAAVYLAGVIEGTLLFAL